MNSYGALSCKLIKYGIAATGLMLTSGVASAAEYWLCTDTTTLTMPDTNEVITMWGFANDDDNDLSNGCGNPVTIPGPPLRLSLGDDSLTVHLRNNLNEPVSIVIPGQTANMTPVMFPDSQGRQRMRAFTHEIAAGATGDYNWNNLKPGTFLYQSGSHPAVQVQMGLYGSLVRDMPTGEAYPGVTYNREVMMFYSEIDPALHTAVVDGSYGSISYPSTVNYKPRYYLVNGKPYSIGDAPVDTIKAGQTVLVRMLNAGLKSHVPTFHNHVRLIAEDGNPYPYSREQYSALLAAGQTRDAILVPASEGSYPIYDSRFDLVNGSNSQGGLMAFLDITAANVPPEAVDDNATTVRLRTVRINLLANDTDTDGTLDLTSVTIVTPPGRGTVENLGNGRVTYQSTLNRTGSDSFTYQVRDNDGALSNIATVRVDILRR